MTHSEPLGKLHISTFQPEKGTSNKNTKGISFTMDTILENQWFILVAVENGKTLVLDEFLILLKYNVKQPKVRTIGIPLITCPILLEIVCIFPLDALVFYR